MILRVQSNSPHYLPNSRSIASGIHYLVGVDPLMTLSMDLSKQFISRRVCMHICNRIRMRGIIHQRSSNPLSQLSTARTSHYKIWPVD